ncbi:P-loop NTPase family protein [Renibacterium salmoninarum]|nr:ATP-binding protein [Renibacterium salmoninarum]
MSGNGKSSLIQALVQRGIRAVDTDSDPAWEELQDGEMRWRTKPMTVLLSEPGPLAVSACIPNQGDFYDRFDLVILLSAPVDVILNRLTLRTNNQFGKSLEERVKILRDIDEVEPLLRVGCDLEIDTSAPFSSVLEQVLIQLG